MAKVLVIPDVHLKPIMFARAEVLLDAGVADFAVQLGDLTDDWGEEFNLPLYSKTMRAALDFHRKYPSTKWLLSNHDWGYYKPKFGKRESGHSQFAEVEMLTWLDEFKRAGIEQKPCITIDNCIFSHAGVNKNWVERHLDAPLIPEGDPVLETGGEALWEEDSPLWWRPQTEYGGDPDEAWEKDKYLQVVGHSPVKTPTQEGSILSCDVFSAYRNGAPYGDQKWVVVDTKTKEWEAKKLEDWLE